MLSELNIAKLQQVIIERVTFLKSKIRGKSFLKETSEKGTHPELEIRFRDFDMLVGKSDGVSRNNFIKLLSRFISESKEDIDPQLYGYECIIEYVNYSSQGNLRKRYNIPISSKDSWKTVKVTPPVWDKKNEITHYYENEYGIKVALSEELSQKSDKDIEFEKCFVKKRYSFIISDNFQLDLTEVHTDISNAGIPEHIWKKLPVCKGEKNPVKYQVELEVLAVGDTLEEKYKSILGIIKSGEINSYIDYVYKQLRNSQYIYDKREYHSTIMLINNVFDNSKDIMIKYDRLPKPRNLNITDFNMDILMNPTGYCVSHKADGERSFLVFSKNGVYLVGLHNEVDKIIDLKFDPIVNTILEGELIPHKNLKHKTLGEYKYVFQTFDVLMYKGDRLKKSGYDVRMKIGVNIKEEFDRLCGDVDISQNLEGSIEVPRLSTLIALMIKPYKAFNTPSEFFEKMSIMFDEQKTLEYNNDGFIFTPINVPYTEQSYEYKGGYDTRSTWDIMKWKPADKMTIDFALVRDPSTQVLRMKTGGPVHGWKDFNGTPDFPVESHQIMDNDIVKDIPPYTVVECIWNDKMFVPVRIRIDKTYPNSDRTAISVWKSIIRPIPEITLTSDGNFQLVRAYHNRIKRDLYYNNPGKVLVDIGSGKGGDLFKMKSLYDHILLVEPSDENLKELTRRMSTMDNIDVFKWPSLNHLPFPYLQAKGQDTLDILKALGKSIDGENIKADVVSMMLSMSFFFSSDETFNQLLHTFRSILSPGGKIIFLTINGSPVKKLLNSLEWVDDTREITMGPVKFQQKKSYPENQLTIHFPGTIVDIQEEWLVDIDRFKNLPDFKVLNLYPATDEKFLSPDGLLYTSLYSYGVIQYIGDMDTTTTTSYILPSASDTDIVYDVSNDVPVIMSPREKDVRTGSIKTVPKETPKDKERDKKSDKEVPRSPRIFTLDQDITHPGPPTKSISLNVHTSPRNPVHVSPRKTLVPSSPRSIHVNQVPPIGTLVPVSQPRPPPKNISLISGTKVSSSKPVPVSNKDPKKSPSKPVPKPVKISETKKVPSKPSSKPPSKPSSSSSSKPPSKPPSKPVISGTKKTLTPKPFKIDPYKDLLENDTIEVLGSTGLGKNLSLVRIGCIDDNDTFIHACLRAVHIPYQEEDSIENRQNIAHKFREGMGKRFRKNYPKNTETYKNLMNPDEPLKPTGRKYIIEMLKLNVIYILPSGSLETAKGVEYDKNNNIIILTHPKYASKMSIDVIGIKDESDPDNVIKTIWDSESIPSPFLKVLKSK